ncbi:hypothetical protein NC00_19550 [Xanthomonas cannabis pv. phaseoli]|uniref:Uncharacterized protein n=1 Tax=Xanthomonas cannabis pv. phaseoli TaxID=1885902 RepID=A0AB34P3N1_9XANT|nr:hypothetical protein NC00_19550 [Xanthomonas cannabis pv. phaseoli]
MSAAMIAAVVRAGHPAVADRLAANVSGSCHIPGPQQAASIPVRPCRGQLSWRLPALASVALGTTAVLVMHLEVFLAWALLGRFVLLARLLALGDATGVVGVCVGWALLVAHGVGSGVLVRRTLAQRV